MSSGFCSGLPRLMSLQQHAAFAMSSCCVGYDEKRKEEELKKSTFAYFAGGAS
jgi:hypothetical protein